MRILYATDGSLQALAGVQFLASLPFAGDTLLTILTVLPNEGLMDAETALASARAVLRESAVSLETQILYGDPADAILEAELTRSTELIVVGSRGLSGVERHFLGSVAERVARGARSSVLVARPLLHGLQGVIFGFDGSERVARAANWFRSSFPLPPECTVWITAVLPLLERGQQPERRAGPILFSALYQQQLQETAPQLEALVAEFAQAGRRVEADVETGEAADTLLRVAEKRQADLIVVGARGLSARDRYLLGSVSEKVLRLARCSVLVVR
jgi:nucleotide-binding universal stress UspA family protein